MKVSEARNKKIRSNINRIEGIIESTFEKITFRINDHINRKLIWAETVFNSVVMKITCWNDFLNRFITNTIGCFSWWLCLSLLLLTGTITGCSSTYAPVEQRKTTPYSVKKKHTGKTPAYYTVKKGDTLYSIAWIYGLDYKSIAYKNRIKPPYRIYEGKKLKLISSTAKSSNRKTYNRTTSKTSSTKTGSVAKKSKTGTKTRSSANNKSTKRAVKSKNKTATFKGNKRLSWKWPVKGKVIQGYSPGSGKKGIDISASKGTLIKSAEAGKVVYSGHGLVGYGKLIIIKHNETYLSAYAHNQHLLVNEGQLVKKGQNIAELGRSGTDRYKLHFEIRKNGKPVNPMSYLPH